MRSLMTNGFTSLPAVALSICLAWLPATPGSCPVLGGLITPERSADYRSEALLLPAVFFHQGTRIAQQIWVLLSPTNDRERMKARIRLLSKGHFRDGPPTTEQVLHDIQAALAALRRPDLHVVLYGSFADGRQDRWSDLDYFYIPGPWLLETDRIAMDLAFQDLLPNYLFEPLNPLPYPISADVQWEWQGRLASILQSKEQRGVYDITASDVRRVNLYSDHAWLPLKEVMAQFKIHMDGLPPIPPGGHADSWRSEKALVSLMTGIGGIRGFDGVSGILHRGRFGDVLDPMAPRRGTGFRAGAPRLLERTRPQRSPLLHAA